MTKLSKAQLELLRILRDENTAVCISNSREDFHTFISGIIGKAGQHNPSFSTMFTLRCEGMIENITDRKWIWCGSKYKISQAGLEALKEAGI